jgi:hypothetical protein
MRSILVAAAAMLVVPTLAYASPAHAQCPPGVTSNQCAGIIAPPPDSVD